ncbi:AAA family ATPase [Methylomonas sp. SURF-2]|uniref:AAA family ATPase n=1 Tax=Methylomonas subterranea TaxID=2952225 RepID=A0ABT1TDE9_9GAMM|nr:AAA family ATPase [Methylomonas sp. SURF-2]MCQ8103481.1 AAA family ATPase [Methylomonas sp. SURF-2]
MLDKGDLTYSYQKRPTVAGNSRQAERALITVDRSQKLDLLIHLLTNLQQSMIVCGPDGIGKTTLLHTFATSHQDTWPICLLPGSAALSFETVVAQLSRFLNLSNASVNFDLSSLRAFCNKQKVILIIDDAGELVPGLIGELIDFADSLAGLRLVLALSSDELQAKTASDGAMEACHIIELPPLNQRQCLEYLQNLSARPSSPLLFNAISDALVEDIYRQSEGVPGRILAELPKYKHYQQRRSRQFGLWLGIPVVVAAVAFAVKSFMPAEIFGPTVLPSASQPLQGADKVSLDPAPPVIEAVTPPINGDLVPAGELLPEARIMLEPVPNSAIPERLVEPLPAVPPVAENIPPSLLDKQAAVSEPGVAAAPAEAKQTEPASGESAPPVEAKPAEQPAAVVAPKPVAAKVGKVESDAGNLDWIMAQPANNYTVQVMVLSNKESAQRFLRKYADYRDVLAYYPVGIEGQEKYVIIYGSFPTSVEALNNKSEMPAEFNGGVVKRFNQVQKASRRK